MSYIFLQRPRVMCKIEVHEIVLDISAYYLLTLSISDRNKTIYYYIKVIFDDIIQTKYISQCRDVEYGLSKNKNFYIQNFKLVDSMSFTFVYLCIIFDVFLAFNLKK